MYTIIFSDDAKKDLKELHKKAPQALPKLAKLLDELREHPRTGTGQIVIVKRICDICKDETIITMYAYAGRADFCGLQQARSD